MGIGILALGWLMTRCREKRKGFIVKNYQTNLILACTLKKLLFFDDTTLLL